jgi:hypothetical protein
LRKYEKMAGAKFPRKSNFYLCQKIIRVKFTSASNHSQCQIYKPVKLPRASNRKHCQIFGRTKPATTARTEPVGKATSSLSSLTYPGSPTHAAPKPRSSHLAAPSSRPAELFSRPTRARSAALAALLPLIAWNSAGQRPQNRPHQRRIAQKSAS